MGPQRLSRQELIEAFRANLEESRRTFELQAPQASIQWLKNVQAQFKSGFRCMKDNVRNANRRTCPKTNETDRRQPLPRNVIGSMSYDKENCPPPAEI